MGARGVKIELLSYMCKYGRIWKDAIAGNWKAREARVLQAREIPAM